MSSRQRDAVDGLRDAAVRPGLLSLAGDNRLQDRGKLGLVVPVGQDSHPPVLPHPTHILRMVEKPLQSVCDASAVIAVAGQAISGLYERRSPVRKFGPQQ